jgi:ribonuclease E
VGKKVRARITAVMDEIAYAERIDRAAEFETPITAEGEAERPTRARRTTKSQDVLVVAEAAEVAEEAPAKPSRKRSPAKKAEAPAADAEAVEEAAAKPARSRRKQPAEVATEVAEAVAEGEGGVPEDGADAASVKKKTRRGTRGGRNRRRKTAAAAEGANGAGPAAPDAGAAELSDRVEPPEEQTHEEPAQEELPAPVIHLPGRELEEPEADEEAPVENGAEAAPRPKRRRGTRGGRGRKRKPAGDDGAAATATVEAEAPEADGPPEGDSQAAWEYTPMSEWGKLDADEK